MYSQALRVVFILHRDVYCVEVIKVERFASSLFRILECPLTVFSVAVVYGVATVARLSQQVLLVPRVVTAVCE